MSKQEKIRIRLKGYDHKAVPTWEDDLATFAAEHDLAALTRGTQE